MAALYNPFHFVLACIPIATQLEESISKREQIAHKLPGFIHTFEQKLKVQH